MANIKIQQLAAKTKPANTDVMVIEDTTSTKKITYANILGGIYSFEKTENSFWIRFENGLQIAFKQVTFTAANNDPLYGGMRQFRFPNVSYPNSFTKVLYSSASIIGASKTSIRTYAVGCFVQHRNNTNDYSVSEWVNPTVTSYVTEQSWESGDFATIGFLAIGFWK